MPHFPELLRTLPKFNGPFDAFRLSAEDCDVLFASYPGGTAIPPHSHPTENVGVMQVRVPPVSSRVAPMRVKITSHGPLVTSSG